MHTACVIFSIIQGPCFQYESIAMWNQVGENPAYFFFLEPFFIRFTAMSVLSTLLLTFVNGSLSGHVAFSASCLGRCDRLQGKLSLRFGSTCNGAPLYRSGKRMVDLIRWLEKNTEKQS